MSWLRRTFGRAQRPVPLPGRLPLAEDARIGAEWAVAALTVAGQYDGVVVDYEVDSLRALDDYLQSGRPRPGGVLTEQQWDALVFALGAYVGEAIRRTVGGEWVPDPDDPATVANACLVLPSGTTVRPVQQVLRRYVNGADDDVRAFAANVCSAERRRRWER